MSKFKQLHAPSKEPPFPHPGTLPIMIATVVTTAPFAQPNPNLPLHTSHVSLYLVRVLFFLIDVHAPDPNPNAAGLRTRVQRMYSLLGQLQVLDAFCDLGVLNLIPNLDFLQQIRALCDVPQHSIPSIQQV
jgi:hypothetical protein